MTATARPKTTGIPEGGRVPGNLSATMMLPQPAKTSVKVPMASARDFLKSINVDPFFRHLFEFNQDHVPDFAEFRQIFLFGFIGLGRVGKGPGGPMFRP